MTNYEQWQLERYGNIVGQTGEKNSRELSVKEKAYLILENLTKNNARMLDLMNELPKDSFKIECLEKLLLINQETYKSILKFYE